jgi:hypothetical protein
MAAEQFYNVLIPCATSCSQCLSALRRNTGEHSIAFTGGVSRKLSLASMESDCGSEGEVFPRLVIVYLVFCSCQPPFCCRLSEETQSINRCA